MPYDHYPTDTELANRLAGAGVKPENITLLQEMNTLVDAVNAAAADWEAETLWKPYLAGPSTTRQFDPPYTMSSGATVGAYRMSLNTPLLAFSSMTANGRTFRQGVDFVFGPQNAAASGDPYQWIVFNTPVYGAPGSISITGRWGKVLEVPDDVWDLLIQRAQMTIAPDLSLLISGGVSEIKVDIFTTKFTGTGSDGPMDIQTKLWLRRWDRRVKLEQRVTF